MSAVLLAVYPNYEAAARVRIQLVRDGFPTDRVELTHVSEPGRAGLVPAASLHGKLAQYFRTLFKFENERHYAERFAERVESGCATVTVHPRGAIETTRATELLEEAAPTEMAQHDLGSQTLEFAAARHDSPWISNLWIDSRGHEHECIYCRLFEHRTG